MLARISFAAIVVFWLTMNFLLWRSQWGGPSKIGNETPLKLVWQKILTAPDNSSLEIFDHDKKIGFCHWTVTSSEALAANQSLQEDYAPGATVPVAAAYALDLDGNVAVASNRVRFDARLTLATNQAWRNFRLRANVKPMAWDVEASAEAQRVTLEDGAVRRAVGAELHVRRVEQPAGGDGGAGRADGAGVPGRAGLGGGNQRLGGIDGGGCAGRAHEDHMQFGHSRVRVYRLETQWLGQRVYLFVSMVGEILWVEFPNGLTLRNEAFDHF